VNQQSQPFKMQVQPKSNVYIKVHFSDDAAHFSPVAEPLKEVFFFFLSQRKQASVKLVEINQHPCGDQQ